MQNVSTSELEAVGNASYYLLWWVAFVLDGSKAISERQISLVPRVIFSCRLGGTYAEPCSAITTLTKVHFRVDVS